MQTQVKESDWKLFRKKLPEWQETYMERLNQEYAALLAASGKASDKFWELERRINADKQHVGVAARMSRSNMYHNILSLLMEGVITLDDLKDFSEDFRTRAAFVMNDRQDCNP
ncbi:multidrug transporter [Ruthenibacterium lactatiformans]|uniref:multidrug transporter n=1 Tax=Ruthenibacterium lactatiformans TaxID=1550024 RepID=UPI00307FFBA4